MLSILPGLTCLTVTGVEQPHRSPPSCLGYLKLPRLALPSLRSVFWTWAPPWMGFGAFLIPRGRGGSQALCVHSCGAHVSQDSACVCTFPSTQPLCLSFPAPFSSHWGLSWNLLHPAWTLTLLGCPSSWRHPTRSHAVTFTLSGVDFNDHLANNNICYNHVLSENSLSVQSGFPLCFGGSILTCWAWVLILDFLFVTKLWPNYSTSFHEPLFSCLWNGNGVSVHTSVGFERIKWNDTHKSLSAVLGT